MAYRAEDITEVCIRCSGVADWSCPRCARHYCASHTPHAPRRCDPCEAEYLARETALVKRFMVTAIIASAAVALLGAFATHAARNGFIAPPSAHLAPLILFAGLFSMAAVFVLPTVLRWRLRRRFLRSR